MGEGIAKRYCEDAYEFVFTIGKWVHQKVRYRI